MERNSIVFMLLLSCSPCERTKMEFVTQETNENPVILEEMCKKSNLDSI